MHQRQLFLNYLAQTSDFPLALEIEKAEGVWLYSPDGKAYMDLIAGIGVSNVGHRHPNVVQAIKHQVDHYLHTLVYGEYVQAPQVQLAEALVQTLSAYRTPMGYAINNVYLTNSGAEAVEGAMKLAKRFTGRTEIISCINAYHGSTQGALSLAGADFFKRQFRPLLPDIRHIHHGVISDLEHITSRTAAVVIEVISAESGIRVPSQEYLQALRARCTETGTLLIFDEIQTGFGRTGSFWAFEQFGTVPDILLSAKGMGGGMPIGAFMAPQELMKVFKENPILGHITTFGGHPVSAAASLATVRTIQEDKLCESVPAKAQLFRELLVHPAIREVRGHGLFMAVEFADFTQLKAIIDYGIENGVITDWFLFCDNSMRIAPPLTITEAEIRQACEVIVQAIDASVS